MLSSPPRPTMTSAPSVPWIVSLPEVPTIVARWPKQNSGPVRVGVEGTTATDVEAGEVAVAPGGADDAPVRLAGPSLGEAVPAEHAASTRMDVQATASLFVFTRVSPVGGSAANGE